MKNRYMLGKDGVKEKDGFKCSMATSRNRNWCVAVKISSSSVEIRDTKDEKDTTLTFTKDEWSSFIEGVKSGEFDI